ncbi:MAG: hypothetical protein L3J97_01845, partial [Thermoplasmata archaeon]|nr:hypothetical protein [Thermoplasmata archaeon]
MSRSRTKPTGPGAPWGGERPSTRTAFFARGRYGRTDCPRSRTGRACGASDDRRVNGPGFLFAVPD